MKIYTVFFWFQHGDHHIWAAPLLYCDGRGIKHTKTENIRTKEIRWKTDETRWQEVKTLVSSVRRLAPSCGSSCLTPAPQLSSVSGVITIVNWQTALRWNHLGAQPSHNALWETLSPALRDESSHTDHIKRSSHRCVQLKFSSPRRCFHRRIHLHRRVHRGHDLLTSWGPLEAEAAGAVSMATAVGRMSLCETQNSYVC